MLELLPEAVMMKPQHEIFANENDVDVLFRPPIIGASFQLGAWGPCHQEEESGKMVCTSEDDKDDCSCSLCISSETQDRDNETGDRANEDEGTLRRVSFCEKPQVRHYTKVLPEEWNRLYYSCHEIQKMMDEYKRELAEREIAEGQGTIVLPDNVGVR